MGPMDEEVAKERKLYIRFSDLVEPTTTGGDDPITNLVYVNDDSNPTVIDNEHFTGQLAVRCKRYQGWTPLDLETEEHKEIIPDTDYFKGHRRLCSFQMTGRFKKEWHGDDIVFGTFFKKPIRPPRGHRLAMRLAKAIDNSLVFDIDRPDPQMYSPLICTMTTFHACPAQEVVQDIDEKKPLGLPEWQYSGVDPKLQENIVKDYEWWKTQPEDSPDFYENCNVSLENLRKSVHHRSFFGNTFESCRRKWFMDSKKRKHFMFHPDMVYSFDMCTPFLDLNEMKLKLGLSFDIEPYLGDQPIRYECRTRDGSIVFWSAEIGRK